MDREAIFCSKLMREVGSLVWCEWGGSRASSELVEYPSQRRPEDLHLEQAGLASSHLTRLILQ